jgi:phosphoribosylaminoimidazole-succinocarboxamide synthase
MEKEDRTSTIVVDDASANIFHLVKGALGCKTSEMFKELLEHYLKTRFTDRLDERSRMFTRMINRVKLEQDITDSYGAVHKSTKATVQIQAVLQA